jgi:hypothetical protein
MRAILLYCVLAVAALSGAAVATAYDDATFQAAVNAALAVDPTVTTQVSNDTGRDIAVGGGETDLGAQFGMGAMSGPTGEDPRGHVHAALQGGIVVDGDVVCLQVSTFTVGDDEMGFALIGVDTGDPLMAWVITAIDGRSTGADSVGFQPSTPEEAADCIGGFAWTQPVLEKGQVLIHDAAA